MLNAEQLRTLIIEPALKDLNLQSDDATELLLFTCATESEGGTYLHQIKGPALGIYQMEPATYNDIWQNFVMGKAMLKLQLIHNFGCMAMPSEDRLIYDLRFATAMCRIHYDRNPDALPKANDVDAIWNYYKMYYNTSAGKAEYHEAVNAYYRFVKP